MERESKNKKNTDVFGLGLIRSCDLRFTSTIDATFSFEYQKKNTNRLIKILYPVKIKPGAL